MVFCKSFVENRTIFINNYVYKLFFFHTSAAHQAGHSKWSNIRHIKALKDGQKSALFTKYARQIRLAIQDGKSADIAINTALRNIVDDAVRKNMPMSTIQNAIKKSSQSKELLKKHLLYIRFQQKVFIICVLYTDNFAHLKMEMAPILKKAGAVHDAIQHLFYDVGIIETTVCSKIKHNVRTKEELENICTEDAIECGAEDVKILEYENGLANFLCSPSKLNEVKYGLKTRGYTIRSSEHVFLPKNTIALSGKELVKYEAFLRKIRDISGVEELYDNLD